MTNFPVTSTDTGLAITESIRIRLATTIADTGVSITASLSRGAGRALSDTGLYTTAPLTPVLDNCARPDETPLSDSGQWTINSPGTYMHTLNLGSSQIHGASGSQTSQMSFTAAHDLADQEAWITVGALPSSGNGVGPVVRQDPSSPTGANCYVADYTTDPVIYLRYQNATSGITVLGSYTMAAASTGDQVLLRARGSLISVWYKPVAGSWSKVIEVTDTHLTHGYVGLQASNSNDGGATAFGGGAYSDQLARTHNYALTDTGLSITDSILRNQRFMTDAGLYQDFPVTPFRPFGVFTENPLSDGGNWVNTTQVYASNLQIVGGNVEATIFNTYAQESYVGAGVLNDCEVYAHFPFGIAVGATGGVVLRQDPGKDAGANCYIAAYIANSGVLQIQRRTSVGGTVVLGSVSTSLPSFDAFIGFRAHGNTLSAYTRGFFTPWVKVLEVQDGTLASGYLGLGLLGTQVSQFGGGSLYDSLTPTIIRQPMVDTGLTVVGDHIAFYAPITDTGLTVADSLASNRIRPIHDTGLTITDHPSIFGLTDTGLTVSDSIHATRVVPRNPTDTLTFSDSTKKTAKHFITDTGLTVLGTLVVQKNGHNASVNITDIGLTITTTLTNNAHYFRSMRFPSTDTGLTIRDGLVIHTTPPFKPKKPKANFTYDDSGFLLVAFTDTSDPGSAPIGSWSWKFGDGVGTSSAQNPTYTYASAGVYNVTLKVVTIYGTSSVTKPVNVAAGVLTSGFHIDAVIV